MAKARIIEGDCREVLASLDAGSVQTCITSPPYYGLRDYGHDGQIGLEETPEQYVAEMVEVFREVRRVLRDDGTLWLNLGDSYSGSGPSGASYQSETTKRRAEGNGQDGSFRVSPTLRDRGLTYAEKKPVPAPGTKPKDLLGIPWMVAFALRADGWYLRSEIIWAKRNCMPESVKDRPTRAHEQIFLLSKSRTYFYDAEAIREEDLGTDHPRNILHRPEPSGGLLPAHNGIRQAEGRAGAGRNKRTVWTVGTMPFPGAHFATFPPKLIEPCVLAGSSPQACVKCSTPWQRVIETERVDAGPKWAPNDGNRAALGDVSESSVFRTGLRAETRTLGWQPTCVHGAGMGRCTVLDPFNGAGTTGLVALRNDRDYIGVEINPDYAQMARERIYDDGPLLNEVAA